MSIFTLTFYLQQGVNSGTCSSFSLSWITNISAGCFYQAKNQRNQNRSINQSGFYLLSFLSHHCALFVNVTGSKKSNQSHGPGVSVSDGSVSLHQVEGAQLPARLGLCILIRSSAVIFLTQSEAYFSHFCSRVHCQLTKLDRLTRLGLLLIYSNWI